MLGKKKGGEGREERKKKGNQDFYKRLLFPRFKISFILFAEPIEKWKRRKEGNGSGCILFHHLRLTFFFTDSLLFFFEILLV